MNTRIHRKPALTPLLAGATLAALASTATAAPVTLVHETFGGSGSASLAGTTPGTFASALTSATPVAGTATWYASPAFKADGSIGGATRNDNSAYLYLGSYINNTRGTADGKFTLTANIAKPTAGTWVSAGFLYIPSDKISSSIDQTFNGGTGNLNGYGTFLHRTSDSGANFFGGAGTTNSNDPGNIDADASITITLDFTPEGGYNGTNNFGTVSFVATWGADQTAEWSYTWTSSIPITGIGFSSSGTNIAGGVSSLTLTQTLSTVPEPANVALLAGALVAAGAIFRPRRHPRR